MFIVWHLIIATFQDICISAVKEKDIEAKLKNVISEWNNEELTFTQFKVRFSTRKYLAALYNC